MQPAIDPGQNVLHAPEDPARWPEWREALQQWREQIRRELSYDDALYRRPDFAWITGNFSCCFLMVCDELFLRDGRYLVEELTAHGRREFGGFDSVVLWHAYPRIGFDERNQFDFCRDLPGGLNGLKEVAQRFRAKGVRSFVEYNPWDTGTRREPTDDLTALANLVRDTDTDGIFLDTMSEGAGDLRTKLDAVRPGVILEGEIALPLKRLHDHHQSWAQGFQDSKAPGVLRNKWVERRHLQHQISRWSHDHTAELQMAWMNGSGMMVWENVFGSWVGWSQRDRSILRAMLPIQRRFKDLFCGENWIPLVPAEGEGIYASQWNGNGVRLWTLVNRGHTAVKDALLPVNPQLGERVFDLVAGRERTVQAGGAVPVEFGPRGIGAILVSEPAHLGSDFGAFLRAQAETAARADFSPDWPYRSALPTRPLPPPGPAEREVEIRTIMRHRECGFYEPQHYWQVSFDARHTIVRRVTLPTGTLDQRPVTNAEFAGFLKKSKYRPRHPEKFLAHWKDGKPVPGTEDEPVVYIDLEDARAFAAWAKKRLPTEEEWHHGVLTQQLPRGEVWEWTDSERSDGRTRFCILRGGCKRYKAEGSHWYTDGGDLPPEFAAKFLLTWPGIDRCSTIGFRCVRDESR